MKRKLVSLALTAVAIVLEALPRAAVLNFKHFSAPGGTKREFFSYFSLTPFGYANFGPLITAFLSCLLLLLLIIALFRRGAFLRRAISAISAAAALISLTPLLFGLHYFTLIGAFITLLLLAVFILSLNKKSAPDGTHA